LDSVLVGHIEAAGDFVEDFLFELRIRTARLFRMQLAHFPAPRHRQQHVPFELDLIHRLDRIRFPVGGRISVDDAREIGGRFGGIQGGQ